MDLPPPPPGGQPTVARRESAHSPAPEPTRRLQLPDLSPAAWLATMGASLLLVASVVVVAGNWQLIAPEARFAGLVAGLLAVYFSAETLRHRVPLTAQALATLAPTLTAPVGIAAMASLDSPWPVCVTVGGVASVVATEAQSRRWERPALKAATVAAAGLAVTGVAALSAVPVGVLGALAAVLFAVAGAQRRSIVLGIAAALAPILQLLAAAGIGPGTIERIGASGDVLGWATPVAATIGAIVVLVAAHRRDDERLVAAAVATLVIGVATGAREIDLAASTWLAVPALALIALEVVDATASRTLWRRSTRDALGVMAPFVALGATMSPVLVGALGDGARAEWAPTLAITAAAMWTTLTGSARRKVPDRMLAPLFAAGALVTIAFEASSIGLRIGPTDVAMLGGVAGAAWLVGRGRSIAWTHAAMVIAAIAVPTALRAADLSPTSATLTLFGAVIAVTLAAFGRRAADALPIGPIESAAITLSISMLGAAALASPLMLSIATTLATAQWTMGLIARRRLGGAAITGALSVTSLCSVWWTSGMNDLVIGWLRPVGADGVDLAIGAASVGTLALGYLLRRVQPVSSWLAFGPGLGMATAWLLSSQFDPSDRWSTSVAIATGVVSAGIGGFRRHAAPLVIGTILLAASIAISVGERLATAPAWLWIAVGGVGLLVVAAVIERTDRPLFASDPTDDRRSILETLRDDYS